MRAHRHVIHLDDRTFGTPIPKANLSALKELLEAKRHERLENERLERERQAAKDRQAFIDSLPASCKALPEKVRNELTDFLLGLRHSRFLHTIAKPNPEWRVFYGDTWSAARKAAQDAAYKDSIQCTVLGKPVSAGVNKAWAQAWDTLMGVVRLAAWTSAQHDAQCLVWEQVKRANFGESQDIADCIDDATGDAELMVTSIITNHFAFLRKEECTAYAKGCWEVWEKGYGIAKDVNGVLYVYCCKGGAAKA